jgi:hypothetical protein
MTNSFTYYNNNPLSLEEEDCVTRAIALASNLPYSAIKDKLYYMAQLLDCNALCVCCYSKLLDYIFQYDRVPCKGYTVGEIVQKYDNSTLLIRMNGHLTCAIDGILYDLWDSSEELADIVWVVN